MRMFEKGLVLLALAIAGGCSTVEAVGPTRAETGHEEVVFERLGPAGRALAYNSGYEQSVRLVVENGSDWANVWEQVWGSMFPTPERPEVDFTRSVVVVVGMGTMPSGGYDIQVTDARRVGDRVEVSILTASPAPGCPVTAALTSPVDIATVSRDGAEIIFVEQATVRGCD
jgi:hypothetical protein